MTDDTKICKVVDTKDHKQQKGFIDYVMITVSVIFPFITMAVGWTANQVVTNTADISGMKANRFTSRDGIEMERRFNQEMTEIKGVLHKIDKKVPDKIPPDWFEAKVLSLELSIERIRKEIELIKQRERFDHPIGS